MPISPSNNRTCFLCLGLYDVFQKYLEIEDQIEVEKRDTQKQIDRLEHENKSLESRIKSYQDHSKCFIKLTNLSLESSMHCFCLIYNAIFLADR